MGSQAWNHDANRGYAYRVSASKTRILAKEPADHRDGAQSRISIYGGGKACRVVLCRVARCAKARVRKLILPKVSPGDRLFHGDGFRQVTRLVNIAPAL